MKILIINGPNLNMLGIREPEIYGTITYTEMIQKIQKACGEKNELTFYQSNHEGDIVDRIQQAYFDKMDGIVINPAAYTHTSVAILDALKAVRIPTVEVHLSDTDKRESFRSRSYIEKDVIATIKGKGIEGYIEAIDLLIKRN